MEIIWLHTGHENHRALLTWNLVHESNFHGALVINRWSNYSTYRYISAKHSWRIYFIGARLWCSTACEKKKKKKTQLERDRCSQIRWPFANHFVIYFISPISFQTRSQIVLFWIFQLSRKKEGPFFFIDQFFPVFFFFLVGNWQYLF